MPVKPKQAVAAPAKKATVAAGGKAVAGKAAGGKAAGGKAVAGKGGKAAAKAVTKPSYTHLFEKRPRNFGIGGTVQPRRDLTRYVRWPKYVLLQRQRRVLYQRLKVPPAITQFTKVADKNTATQVLRILNKYRPEDAKAKKLRLTNEAAAKLKGEKVEKSKPTVVKFGINHVTALIEQRKAKMVVIAHDVDPVELVLWLPALCRKKDIPYVIIKSKARLGAVVHHKTATALAICDVNKEDKAEFANLTEALMNSWNQNADLRRTWGGGRLGHKSTNAKNKKLRTIAKEERKRSSAVSF